MEKRTEWLQPAIGKDISFLEPVTAMTQRGEETSEMGLRNLEDLAQDVAIDRTLYGNDHDVLHFNMPQRIRRPKS